MWIASPAHYDFLADLHAIIGEGGESPSGNYDSVMIANCYGDISGTQMINNSGGARPIVALKSSTKIEKQEEGIYKIVP